MSTPVCASTSTALPAGFPATETGVELRILKRLFTPEEAGLAVPRRHATRNRPGRHRRAARVISEEEAERPAQTDVPQGAALQHRGPRPDRNRYMAAQFVIGIWEYHVNDLDPELIRDMEEYLPVFVPRRPSTACRSCAPSRSARASDAGHGGAALRAGGRDRPRADQVPGGPLHLPHASTELKGAGCEKLMEACLIFGWAADYYARNGLGRFITLEETLAILKHGRRAGAGAPAGQLPGHREHLLLLRGLLPGAQAPEAPAGAGGRPWPRRSRPRCDTEAVHRLRGLPSTAARWMP
ncbi:MAG: hypothetical protein MZV70_56540 [Desulfobacterales bacterium]|nr:hypothetical protein [Desulfobacterales bacterium]